MVLMPGNKGIWMCSMTYEVHQEFEVVWATMMTFCQEIAPKLQVAASCNSTARIAYRVFFISVIEFWVQRKLRNVFLPVGKPCSAGLWQG